MTPSPPTPITFTPPVGCVPNAAVFDQNVAPALDESCGGCHGAQPAFGAPYSLVTYEDVMTDNRHEAVLETLMVNAMPPQTAAAMEHSARDTVVVWASCGELHPPPQDGLIANRPVFEATEDPPPTAFALDLTAVDEYVGPTVLDDYRRFNFSNLVDSPKYIRRIEPVIDDSRVLHHITLTDRDTDVYYYAWAPGTGPIQFPSGGVRVTADTRLQVEIHYNNGAGVDDVADNSGVKLFLDEPVGTEWAMATPQTWLINVPAFSAGEANQSCTAVEPFTILAGMPHMHGIGEGFNHEIERVDGTVDNLINLTGWSFEAQYIYEMNTQVNAGDTLHMRCEYMNDTPNRVLSGLGTNEEMCYDFLYVTPPSAVGQCSGPF